MAKPPTRNANCPRSVGSGAQEYQSTRTELIGRRRLKLSLIESAVVWIEGSKDAETCALYARMFGHQFINAVGVGLPSQRQLPGLDSALGIIISPGAEFDVLILAVIRSRKDLLHPFVESLGKLCKVFGGVEFGFLQLLWLQNE